MLYNFLKTAIASSILLISTFASAGLIYNEGVSGDSGHWLIDPALLGTVVNDDYVLGFVDRSDGHPIMWDGYLFNLDGNINIITISSETILSSGFNDWQTYSTNSSTPLANKTLRFDGILNSITFDVQGLSGDFKLGNNYLSLVSDDRYDYEIRFSYARVPEPSTLLIFALGIIGLSSGRYSKK